MIRFLKSLYLTPRFFYAIAVLVVLFLLSYGWNEMYGITWLVALGIGVLILFEVAMLYSSSALSAKRILPEKFSNSDQNEVMIQLTNKHPFTISVGIVDELPVQFQKRDFFQTTKLLGKERTTYSYSVRPVERGAYVFGNLNLYASSVIGLLRRRYTFSNEQKVKVYPSFIQMKKYDFLAIDNRLSHIGLKKIRKIGHTMEFEQIKEYVSGDDVRTVNWKATAKQARLMVNQFQDEKMQPVYSIIDTSRVMKMPFNELKLVDYAINSALAFSNIALKKNDKVGLVNFSNTIGNFLPAQAKKTYLNNILETLYNMDSEFLDSDFGLLQAMVRRRITHRSLLLLYTNFEHISSLHRKLPYLQAIAKKHVLVVIFFENTELRKLSDVAPENVSDIFDQTIAQQFQFDKKLMVRELQQRGIQTVLTAPEDLTVNTINKYLEIKARGLL
ncbi:MAG TPA: DUF58 domain-containing protein [Flavobacteriaceae bacterium]|nr:DUF58 domain-containing protein [Flavobacteriaceae bacterium]MAY51941.1 DUF58 domain-containing protein [Flavobacteriaceae bacterium]HBR54807.1 DUF58 domain-containing protein [Flavobacteriaceae bacterium]HIB48464.1 DUF58 domain-containing protein [Flavobacteriaceae bacterium]HIN98330.1 DUF58 domain-containing protein [Flavobacteriaceae bacterium]|tara:strand:+ start:72541 stop:73872 length:1332 start_codon:yes stop_codon:yes gene_type:complete